jgi:hypothetical protein
MYSFKDIALIVGTCLFVLVIILLPIILPVLFPPIYAGVVTHKEYKPRHTYMMPVFTGKITTYQPRIRPEAYNITIVKGDKEATHTVDKDLYERVKIGDYIDIKGKLYVQKVYSLFTEP